MSKYELLYYVRFPHLADSQCGKNQKIKYEITNCYDNNNESDIFGCFHIFSPLFKFPLSILLDSEVMAIFVCNGFDQKPGN